MPSPGFNESTVEEAALSWFDELGYGIGHGPTIAPGEPAAERKSFADVILVSRLRDAIDRINLDIPQDAREEALRKVLLLDSPSLVGANQTFHWMLRDGVEVEYRRKDGLNSETRTKPEIVSKSSRVIFSESTCRYT